MKKLLYIFLTIICYSNLYGQISIDSIKVYQTDFFVDSIYISGTSKGQILRNIDFTPFNDGCGSTFIRLHFEGCISAYTIPYDTTFIFVVSHFTKKIRIPLIWDTTGYCSYPVKPLVTDIMFWDSCSRANPKQLSYEKQLKIYTDSIENTLKIEGLEGVVFREIQLIKSDGHTIIKNYKPNERLLDIRMLPPGLSFLKIETEDGYHLRRKVIVQ